MTSSWEWAANSSKDLKYALFPSLADMCSECTRSWSLFTFYVFLKQTLVKHLISTRTKCSARFVLGIIIHTCCATCVCLTFSFFRYFDRHLYSQDKYMFIHWDTTSRRQSGLFYAIKQDFKWFDNEKATKHSLIFYQNQRSQQAIQWHNVQPMHASLTDSFINRILSINYTQLLIIVVVDHTVTPVSTVKHKLTKIPRDWRLTEMVYFWKNFCFRRDYLMFQHMPNTASKYQLLRILSPIFEFLN